jgi:glucokinase
VDCILTISSGIGHKIFVDGAPVVGPEGRGGEIGHLRVDFSVDAPICECGGQGHLGAVASGRAVGFHMHRTAKSLPPGLRDSPLARWLEHDAISDQMNQELVAHWRNNDALAHRVVTALAEPLGRALAALHLSVGAQRFVLMGGFALALGEPYRQLLADAAAKASPVSPSEWLSWLELGFADDDSGLLGLGKYLAACAANEVS